MTFKLASDIKIHFDQDHDLRHPTEISHEKLKEQEASKLTSVTVNDVRKK